MKWVHISDIHYNPLKDGASNIQLRRELINFLKENGIKADYLFVTGDFRNAAKQYNTEQTIEEIASFFSELIEVIGIINSDNVFFVPGNHDLDRNKNANIIEEEILSYDCEDGEFKEENIEALLGRFDFYYKIVEKVCGRKEKNIHEYYSFKEFNLICLNTAILCSKDNEEGKIVFGNKYLLDIINDNVNIKSDLPVFILAHHGMDLLAKREKEILELYLRKLKNVYYLCGHSHNSWYRKINNITELTMGTIKYDVGIQSTFSYGNIKHSIIDINAYVWDNRFRNWARYESFNSAIKKK